jgi:hypothetical protein
MDMGCQHMDRGISLVEGMFERRKLSRCFREGIIVIIFSARQPIEKAALPCAPISFLPYVLTRRHVHVKQRNRLIYLRGNYMELMSKKRVTT